MTQARARLELLSRAGWDHQTPNMLRAIAHHPRLLEPFLGFAASLARGELPRRESELLALRAAWNCRSEFEWGHHVLYARAAGLSDAEIAAIASDGSGAADWSDADRALLRAADELHAQKSICDATFAALASRWSAAQLVEIAFVVGQYTMLSMVAGALAVPLEDGLPPLPRAAGAEVS
jgi:4-carboxymuconolactone decarboxylase